MRREFPPLTALRAFEAVARHLSFSHAAEELNVTHAAVSQQIKALETWLGLKLFDRRGRRTSLTEAGRSYQNAVGHGFDIIHEATQYLRQSEEERPVEITTTTAFASRWLIPRLRSFQEQHPQIRLKMMPGNDLVDFERDNVDIGIRYGSGDWPDLKSEPLVGGELVPVCSPILLDNGPSLESPADLKNHIIIHDMDFAEWEHWLEMMEVDGVKVEKGLVYSMSGFGYEAAIQGQGVYMGVYNLIRDDLREGRLVMPFGPALLHKGGYHIVSRRGSTDRPSVAAFRSWLKTETDRAGLDPYAPQMPEG